MIITNTTSQDLCFNIDVNQTVKVVSRLVIPANGNPTVTIQDTLLLVLISNAFHDAYNDGTITVTYSLADSVYLGEIIDFALTWW